MDVIGTLLLVFAMMLVAAQGAVVFVTALLALRLLKTSHWLAKIIAMLVAYVAWSAATITGYTLLGGDGGLMDGGALLLTACFTAMVSSFAYLVIWTVWPLAKSALQSSRATHSAR